MSAKAIKDILNEYLKGPSFKKINETINLEKAWNEIVGKTISKKTKIIGSKNGILIIKTTNPIWRNELSLQKQNLCNKINKIQKIHDIKEIKFK